jgi:hypothetical protein
MLSKKDRLVLQVGETQKQTDPVVPDQAGRMLRADPVHPIVGAEIINPDLVRVRAYELYEQKGHQAGTSLDDWLQAESELQSTPRPLAKGTVTGPEPIGAPELSSRL